MNLLVWPCLCGGPRIICFFMFWTAFILGLCTFAQMAGIAGPENKVIRIVVYVCILCAGLLISVLVKYYDKYVVVDGNPSPEDIRQFNDKTNLFRDDEIPVTVEGDGCI